MKKIKIGVLLAISLVAHMTLATRTRGSCASSGIADEGISGQGQRLIGRITSSQAMTELDFSQGGIVAEDLPDVMGALSLQAGTLKSLILRDIPGFPKTGILPVSRFLGETRVLESLDMSYARLTDAGMINLADTLAPRAPEKSALISTLKSLAFRGPSDLTEAGMRKLFHLLASCKNLQNLVMTEEFLNDRAIDLLIDAGKSSPGDPFEHLNTVDLSRNPSLSSEGLRVLGRFLRCSGNIVSINLKHDNITDEGMKNFVRALRRDVRKPSGKPNNVSETLGFLAVGGNADLTGKGISFLGQFLGSCKNLKWLSLAEDSIDDKGIETLVALWLPPAGAAAPLVKTLRYWDLRSNRQMTLAGVKALEPLLKTTQGRLEIDLDPELIRESEVAEEVFSDEF